MAVEGWNEKSLASISHIEMGQSPSSSLCNESGVGLPFYQGNAEFGVKHPTASKWIEIPLKKANKGDILFSVRAPVGEMNIADTDAGIGRGLCAIRALSVDHNFLFYSLSYTKSELARLSQGSTFEAINKRELEGLSLAIPPLQEQKKIAEILGSVDEAIAKTEAVIAQTQRVKQGLMQQLLTRGIGHTKFKQTEIGEIPESWSVEKVGSICESIVPGRNKPKVFNGDIPWIGVQDLKHDYVFTSQEGNFVSIEAMSEAGGKLMPQETVLMSCAGQLGKLGIAGRDLVANQQIHGFVCRDSIRPKYLLAALSICLNQMQTLSGQTTISYLNKATCESIKIALPSVKEQEEIIVRLDSVNASLPHILAQRARLVLLKKGLMSDLLTGRVRVKMGSKKERAA